MIREVHICILKEEQLHIFLIIIHNNSTRMYVSLTLSLPSTDNIAPGKVWVLEVFLTAEEESQVNDALKNYSGFKDAYSSLDRATRTTMSSITQRWQSSETSTTTKSRGKWRRRQTNKSSTVGTSFTDGGSHDSVRSGKPPPIQATFNVTSTPLAKQDQGKKSSTSRSEDAIVFSPNMSTVFFDKPSPEIQQRHSSSSSTRQDADESEFVDAVESMDTSPDIGKGAGGNPPSPVKTIPPRREDSDTVFEDARPGSVSSEVFATPSPSPPRESKTAGGNKDTDDDTLTRAQNKTIDPAILSNEELTKLINTPVFLNSSAGEASLTTVKTTGKTPAMALPPSWKFKATPDSDCDDDFVDSETLEKMLQDASIKKAKDDDFVDSSDIKVLVQKNSQQQQQENSGMKLVTQSSPPPLPPRNLSSPRPQPRPLQGKSLIAPPPLPPRNYTLNRNAEDSESLTAIAAAGTASGLRPSIYDTLGRDASLHVFNSM